MKTVRWGSCSYARSRTGAGRPLSLAGSREPGGQPWHRSVSHTPEGWFFGSRSDSRIAWRAALRVSPFQYHRHLKEGM